MKKVLLMLVAGAFISTGMISCSKCGHCNLNGTTGPQYCSSNNHVVYDAAAASCGTGGGTWVTK